MRPLFRPLPLSVVTMALLVMVKLVGVMQALGPSLASAGASAGRTMLPSAIAAETKHDAPPAPVPAAAHQTPAPQLSASQPTGIQPSVAPVVPAPSDAERALLVDLRARREALDSRAQTIESRDALLKAAERGLADRLSQLTAMQTRLETLEKSRRELDEANWRGLVKTYETMRPRDAAAIFNDLEQTVLMQVLDRMKEAKAAPVLAAMQPERARVATIQLAKWRSRAAGGTSE